ncbi:CHAD domain-containing protein [Pseudoxanthomonas sp. Root630]|uniref:CHAD domain-containing protein n=1 Tax=Pseudoxanthomonas sp. Root630 TaxID=1736574 RepID=UPI000703B512|nr:CHAD domain-containing protein [Pseudoxanthomonas sp. Root630]KRA46219.1 hypothetical protein ASD72_03070 [Pseudoxanthomonas sp. Root630]
MPGASSRTGKRVAALAADEIQVLAEALAAAPAAPAGVHEARKSIRRLRSLLALVRAALGKADVRTIDDALKTLAKGLSALRDGQVVLDAADHCARHAGSADEAATWDALRPLLVHQQEHRVANALADDPGFMRRQARAHREAERLRALPWHRLHANDLRHGLARSVRRQQRSQEVALASGSLDDLHDLRRKSRRLRMQLNTLKRLRVSTHGVAAATRDIAELVDQLGALQDLALLQRSLSALEPAPHTHAWPVATRRRMTRPSPIHPLA